MSDAQAIVQEYKEKTVGMIDPWEKKVYQRQAHEEYERVWMGYGSRGAFAAFDEDDYERWRKAQIEHAHELAAAGAMYMDENYPDWRDQVSATSLDMGSSSQCVLGQYFGDYDHGINEIWGRHFSNEDETDSDTGRKLGFLSNGACYMALDLAWQDELLARGS